jgi:hypothetical protein
MSPVVAVFLLVVFALIMIGAVMAVASSLGKRHGHGSRTKSRRH